MAVPLRNGVLRGCPQPGDAARFEDLSAAEQECIRALSSGPAARGLESLGLLLKWGSEALQDVLCGLDTTGWVQTWDDNPEGPSVSLTALALERLGLKILHAGTDRRGAVAGQYGWVVPLAASEPGPTRRQLEQARAYVMMDNHDAELRQAVDPNAVVPPVAVETAEEAAAIIASQPKGSAERDLAWPLVFLTGSQPWRISRGAWLWPALDGEPNPPGACPVCGGQQHRPGHHCLVCLPSIGKVPEDKPAYQPGALPGGLGTVATARKRRRNGKG